MFLRSFCRYSAPSVSKLAVRNPLFGRQLSSAANAGLELQKQQVLQKLGRIIDPDLKRDIVSLGFVKNLEINNEDGNVKFTLELTTPACPVKQEFQDNSAAAVKELPWVKNVEVSLSAKARNMQRSDAASIANSGLKHVTNIIAVSSCKGGVGKSTVAINLAYSLSNLGGKVAVFDADIYGPSVPTLVGGEGEGLQKSADGKHIVPKEHMGVKLMSYGWAVKSQSTSSVMRGPMVSNLVNQLLHFTQWGEIDYLVIDFPPGTGDIQLTLCQQASITAAVIVTTPQKLSYVDVLKGIDMFEKLKVPTVALVENMAYFVCSNCTEKHFPFGEGHSKKILEKYSIPASFLIPIRKEIAERSDSGRPLTASINNNDNKDDDNVKEKKANNEGIEDVQAVYNALGRSVIMEISKLRHIDNTPPLVEFSNGQISVIPMSGNPVSYHPRDLRLKCRCAECIDEQTGAPILQQSLVPKDVQPVDIIPKGNYAVAITWSDGHNSSIYPYSTLLETEK